MSLDHPATERIVSIPVSALDYETTTALVMAELAHGRSGYVCNANVHMVMEGWDDESFADAVSGAFLVTSDGMPLVWMLRALGHGHAERVYGPTFMLHVCAAAERASLPIALYGGTEQSLEDFQAFLKANFPELQVACAISPPFRPPTAEEDRADTERILASGARLVFVGIGCPKQERWMYAHKERLPGIMQFGVGAAFDFHSGRVKQAPPLLQRLGLEWLFRLVMEPKRLWRRYFLHNPRFLMLAGRQLLKERFASRPERHPERRMPHPVRAHKPDRPRAAHHRPAPETSRSARTLDRDSV